jgi:hypothetical protein
LAKAILDRQTQLAGTRPRKSPRDSSAVALFDHVSE